MNANRLLRNDRDILGEFAVYPGHAITIGLIIMETYDSYESASRLDPQGNYPDALSNNAIPGAGGNVWSAMLLLKRLVGGELTVEGAFQRADDNWASCDGQKDAPLDDKYDKHGRWQRGQEQADRLKERVREKLQSWK